MENPNLYTLVLSRSQLKLLYDDVNLFIRSFDAILETPLGDVVEAGLRVRYSDYISIRDSIISVLFGN